MSPFPPRWSLDRVDVSEDGLQVHVSGPNTALSGLCGLSREELHAMVMSLAAQAWAAEREELREHGASPEEFG